MDPSKNFAASLQYPLHYTTYLPQTGDVFTPSRPSSSFQTPHSMNSTPQKTCSCICTCAPMPHQTIWPTQTHAQHNLPIVTHKHAGGKDPDKGNHTQNFSDFLSPSKKQKQTYTKQQTIDE